MKKETLEYLNGERNVAIDEFVVGRERTGNSELILVSLPECEKPLYALWNSKKTAKKYKMNVESGEVTFELITPKGTGGKESYVMLMPNSVTDLNKSQISLDAAGMIFRLIDCIEWNTGRIYRKRDKKSMTINMLSSFLNIGKLRAKTIIRELTKLGVIYYDNKNKAYFFNAKYIRKGATPREN